jgi:hypothetical protein
MALSARHRGRQRTLSAPRLCFQQIWVAYPTDGSPWLRLEIFAGPRRVPTFATIGGCNAAHASNGGWLMGSVDLWRRKAEACLEKAHAISDRQRARLLLVKAHNYLKDAEETEARQLSARRAAETQLAV